MAARNITSTIPDRRRTPARKEPAPAPRLVKIQHAAAYLNCSPWKIRNLVQQGKLPYIPGDGERAPWLFDMRDLDRYVENVKITL